MSNTIKTVSRLIEEHFGSHDSYSTWLYNVCSSITEAHIKLKTAEFKLMVLFPEIAKTKTEAGLEIPTTCIDSGTHGLTVGINIDTENFNLCQFDDSELIYVRPYGNIKVSDAVWLVPVSNILFSVNK